MGERRAVWMRAGVASVGLWVFGSLFSQTLPTEPLPTPLTPWLSGNPTIPTYIHCLNHPTVIPWSYTFQTGCYDVVTGEALDCQETWILYWSTEGVAAQEVDHFRGSHLHPRQSGEHPLASIGEIQLDVMAQRSARSGEWRTAGRSHDATVFFPEAAGVSRLFIYFVAPPRYYAVTNDVWVWDPSDRTHRAGMATLLITSDVSELEKLPASSVYEKASNPHEHSAGEQFYGTPEMNKKLADLAKAYQDAYAEAHQGTLVTLSFNDLSLKYGGIFDVDGNWDCPHALHRVGRSVDVNHTCCPWLNKEEVDLMASRKFKLVEMHTKPGDENIHLEMQEN